VMEYRSGMAVVTVSKANKKKGKGKREIFWWKEHETGVSKAIFG
jgi:hypothetical protein